MRALWDLVCIAAGALFWLAAIYGTYGALLH
jgi:hypothetical protein